MGPNDEALQETGLMEGCDYEKIAGKAGQAGVLFRVFLSRFGLRMTYLL